MIALSHLLGAAVGGSALGLIVGLIGEALPSWGRLPVLACLAGYALFLAIRVSRGTRLRRHAIRFRRPGIGLRRQVPRRLLERWSAVPTYAVWGALLGLGVMTVIPYSAFLVLGAGQLLAGPFHAAISGAVFGLAREATTLVPLARRATPGQISSVLTRFAKPMSVLNVAVILTAAIALAIRL